MLGQIAAQDVGKETPETSLEEDDESLNEEEMNALAEFRKRDSIQWPVEL